MINLQLFKSDIYPTILNDNISPYILGLNKNKNYSLKGYTKTEIKKAIFGNFNISIYHNSFFIKNIFKGIYNNYILMQKFDKNINAYILSMEHIDILEKYEVKF